jgi:hypothetical protein
MIQREFISLLGDAAGRGQLTLATTMTARKLSWHRVVSVRPTRRSFQRGLLADLQYKFQCSGR